MTNICFIDGARGTDPAERNRIISAMTGEAIHLRGLEGVPGLPGAPPAIAD